MIARVVFAVATALLGIAALAGSAARPSEGHRAAGQITTVAWPYVPGSVVPVRVDGFPVPYHVGLVGEGTFLSNGEYAIPSAAKPGTVTLIAGNAGGLAARNLRIGVAPSYDRSIVAVAAYDDGIVFHDPSTFGIQGVLGTGGTPSDATFDTQGRLAATDTQGDSVTIAALDPWNVSRVAGAPLGDEVAIDDRTGAVFVTDRDVGGKGALTRIDRSGSASTVVTGMTAEGLAVDVRRGVVYVANTNDGTVAVVNARTMRVTSRFRAVDRVFSLALSPDGDVLYAISNQSAASPFAAPGSAVAFSVGNGRPRAIARSAHLTFPVGAAFDARSDTLFVTDESSDVVYVLDGRTLRERHPPLPTCHTPWKPALDLPTSRLYVPCARSDEVDVIDVRTLRRAPGAPFRTGGYPLAVSVWHPQPAGKRSSM